MTGAHLMTGTPTYRSRSPVAPYLVDIDVEKHLSDDPPEIVDWILRLMKRKDWVLIGLSWGVLPAWECVSAVRESECKTESDIRYDYERDVGSIS